MKVSSSTVLCSAFLFLTVLPFQGQSQYYEPRPSSWLGVDPSYEDAPADYTSYFPYTYVVLGFQGVVDVRTIVEGPDCPMAMVGDTVMEEEQGAVYSIRANGTLLDNEELPYQFPVQVCSIVVPPQTSLRQSLVDGTVVLSYRNMTYDNVPIVKTNPKRFLLTGDTGLRVKPTNLALV